MATGPADGAASSGGGVEGGTPAVRPGWRETPHPARLDATSPRYRDIIEAHDRASAEGDLGYPDPATGLFVMTAVYLHRRGSCCDRGCRHCPYVGAATATGEAPP